jgi:hypothetical protein
VACGGPPFAEGFIFYHGNTSFLPVIVIGIGTTASQAADKRKRQHLSQHTGVIKSLVCHYPGTAGQSEGISEGINDVAYSFIILY